MKNENKEIERGVKRKELETKTESKESRSI
jgi:hypothetical protein